MQIFVVGGAVRDELMGRPSKDLDFTVVLEPTDFPGRGTVVSMPTPFEVMVSGLKRMGFRIFLETPQYFTVRARFPDKEQRVDEVGLDAIAFAHPRLTADFVLARREYDYIDGRRPERVEPGDLQDDLARRDLTINAMAKDSRGNIIDPFGGRYDIANGVLRAVGNPRERLSEDALRAVRALRFAVTLGFRIDRDLAFAMELSSVLDDIAGSRISDDRIRDELNKMLSHDTVAAVEAMNHFPALTTAMFNGRVNLMATMKERVS